MNVAVESIVYYNGKFYKESEAVISSFSRGLLYGDGVFETVRAYSGRVFRFEHHLRRLSNGLRFLRIEPSMHVSRIPGITNELLQKNGLTDAAIRITAFRGDGGVLDPPAGARETLLISAKPLTVYCDEDYERGMQAQIVSIRRNIFSPISRIKSLNYLDNILGRLEARDRNAQEALFLNTAGDVAEGAVSNIFIIKNKCFLTPPVAAGILPGITREVVLELASQTGQKATEKTVTAEELLQADEAFLTNSLMEIMPLTHVNGQPIGSGKPGKATRGLMERYRKLVKQELEISP